MMTQMSRASKRPGFEVFAGPNRQGIDLLKTLQEIQRQFGEISKNKDIAAAPAIIASWGPIKAFFATLIPQAFEWGVNLLKAFGAKRSEHTSEAKRNERASLRAAFGITSLRAAHIAMESVVTRMPSYLPFSPARVGPLWDLHRVHVAETIAHAIQPAPMLAAMRRVAAIAAVTMPMMIGGAAMPAPGAISSPAGAVVLNYAPHVEIHAPGGDTATLEKALMDALDKNRREVYRMLEQVAGRRDRTRY
jgi:hypothetical protein